MPRHNGLYKMNVNGEFLQIVATRRFCMKVYETVGGESVRIV